MQQITLDLKIVILDADLSSANVLKAIIENEPNVQKVKVFTETKSADQAFEQEGFNSLFIDIFSLDVETGISFIKNVRSKYPYAPICLYSPSDSIAMMHGVDNYWKEKLAHYYHLSKDLTLPYLKGAARDTLHLLSRYLENKVARYRLSDLRSRLSQEPTELSNKQKQEIEEIAAFAEKVLETKELNRQHISLVPGVNTGKVEELVNETLEEAKKSLRTTTKVNIGVLVTGSLLVIASFSIAVTTNQWEAVAFGGFGMAGIITSLITNHLSSG